jgi:hypothetical protein
MRGQKAAVDMLGKLLRATVALVLCVNAARASNTPVDVELLIEPFGQIFPSLELALRQPQAHTSTASMAAGAAIKGESDSLIGVAVTAARAGEKIAITVSAEPYLQPSVLTTQLQNKHQRYQLYPKLRWDYTRLANVKNRFALPLRFSIVRDGKTSVQQSTATLRATSEAIYGVRYPKAADDLDLNWIFAGYVNEDSRVVNDVLKLAKQTGVVASFDGYRSGDREQIYAQVFAVWNALQRRGIKYSNLNPKQHADPRIFSQYVRSVEQSWNGQKANCVDGSVLLASVLMKIGIRPVLVVLPRHMLLGFYANPAQDEIVYLETTMIGDVPVDGSKESLRRSLQNFEAAMAEGERQFSASESRFSEARNYDFQLIDVAKARAAGVQAIYSLQAGNSTQLPVAQRLQPANPRK